MTFRNYSSLSTYLFSVYCQGLGYGAALLCRLIWQARQTPTINEGLRSIYAPKGQVRGRLTVFPIWITRKKEMGFLPCLRHTAGESECRNKGLP